MSKPRQRRARSAGDLLNIEEGRGLDPKNLSERDKDVLRKVELAKLFAESSVPPMRSTTNRGSCNQQFGSSLWWQGISLAR